MKSLFNIIEIYLENPSDKDMERVLERESTKNNTVKMYEKIKALERQLAEAREALLDFEKHVIKHNYHVSNPILNKHETLLKQLKEKGE